MDNKVIIIAICVVYFAVLLGIGFWSLKRTKKATDFLIAGKKLGLLMTSFTICAVQVGAGVVVGGATSGSQMGVWPGMYYAFGCGAGCILAGIFIAGKVRKIDGVVPLDYFETRFGHHRAVRAVAWFTNVPSMLGIFVAQLLACGSILAAFGMPFWFGVVVCAVVILIYSSMGGMWAVVVGDLVQVSIMLIGIPIAAIAALVTLSHTGVPALSTVFGTPFIPSGLFTKFIYLASPFLISISVSYDAFMRYNSSKDVKTAKWGCIIGGILTIVIGTLASAIGAAGHILFPDVTEGVFAHTVAATVPTAFAGIVIAAVLAAAMSSGNCLLVAMGASFSRDLYNKVFHPDKNLDELPYAKTIARWTVIIAAAFGIFFTFKMTNILDAIIMFNYPYAGAMTVPLLVAVLYRRATAKGCFAAMFVGGAIGIACFLAGMPGPLNGWVNPDMGLFIAYTVSLIVLMIVSEFDKTKYPMVEEKLGKLGA